MRTLRGRKIRCRFPLALPDSVSFFFHKTKCLCIPACKNLQAGISLTSVICKNHSHIFSSCYLYSEGGFVFLFSKYLVKIKYRMVLFSKARFTKITFFIRNIDLYFSKTGIKMIYELKEYEFFEYFASFFHLTLINKKTIITV